MLEHNLFQLNEKFNIFMNIEKEDKERFKEVVSWTSDMLEMIVKEKSSRNLQPIRGEIWTCNFGQNVGSEVNKVRPALIISDDSGNCKSATVTVIPITSREPHQATHVKINPESDLLYVENAIMGTITSEGLRNISKARLGRKIGKLNYDCINRVEDSIKKALGFNVESKDYPTDIKHV